MRSRVAIVDHSSVNTAIEQALDFLGTLSDLFRDRHVAIKPNETWASPEDTSACTQAETVRAVIKIVKSFNPYKITVTGGSGGGETDQIFEYLGIDKVLREEKVEFFDHNRGPFEKVHLRYCSTKEVVINPHIFSYDTIVSLAQHKVHKLAEVTLSMKNIAMSFPAADYYGHPRYKYKYADEVFFNDLHGFIAGMCHRFPIHLGIVTGHPAMIGTGPIGGKTFESNLVLASKDFVALDSIGAAILNRWDVAHIKKAQQIGMGNADLEKIDIVGVAFSDAVRIFNSRAEAFNT
ncbi:DUF362 domain-containing protein [Chitinispirillales bacterium ANBcel5]|uniref:DUF362 domain-containing protein n=1 Tax=Cellulosispirillum alkaliphilum TaxID=3039283 RepID=UPI002A584DF5|nr:DUF362 domain-containing protein [Chitinispirillales bacterium ANBcel5]